MPDLIVKPSLKNLKRAAELLAADKLVCIPTETVYGLAGNAFSATAIENIFAAKGRPKNNPLIVHTNNLSNIYKIAKIETGSIIAERLEKIADLWPGPLSVILPKADQVPNNVTAESDFVAVRIPSHPATLELLGLLDFPIAAPSANRFTEISPTTARHCLDSLGEAVEMIIDGGACKVGIESTVINLCSSSVEILRPGFYSQAVLEKALGEEVLSIKIESKNKTPQLSPGLSKKHYAPKTPLKLRSDFSSKSDQAKKIGLITFSSDSSCNEVDPEQTITLSKDANLEEISQRLFAALREMDQLKLDLILIDSCAEIGLGAAIMDRIKRALTEE